MLTRLAAALIILFWLLMTGLHLHRTWLGGANLLEVPTETVLSRFLIQDAQDVLALYIDGQRRGSVNVSPAELPPQEDGIPRHRLTAFGTLFGATPDDPGGSWRISLRLIDRQRVESLEVRIASGGERGNVTELSVGPTPQDMSFTVRQGGELLIDSSDPDDASAINSQVAGLIGGALGTPGTPGTSPLSAAASTGILIRAYEGNGHYGGRSRKVLRLTLGLFTQEDIVITLSEAGEVIEASALGRFKLRSPLLTE
jgi:hypothetical protein